MQCSCGESSGFNSQALMDVAFCTAASFSTWDLQFMAISQENLYKYHVENLRAVDASLIQVARSVKFAIKSDDDASHSTFKPLYILLCGVWSECRFQKLLYEPQVTLVFRQNVKSESSQFDRWKKLIEEAFRLHYTVPKSQKVTRRSLGFTSFSRYEELGRLLDEELRPIIELRNKLAHGQWVYPLNNSGSELEQEKFRELRSVPFIEFYYRRKLLANLADIIHTLVVSKNTFERDFDSNYDKLLQTYEDLRQTDPDNWADLMRKRFELGKNKRRENLQS